MDEQLYNFLNDLITLLHEKYNETLEKAPPENPEDLAYRMGLNFAYYDTLNLIESQLKVMGFDIKSVKEIVPMLGKKI